MGKKMGRHNPITAERWQVIKSQWEKVQQIPANDAYIAKICDISKTTAGLVRRTSCYYEYCLRTDKRLKNIRHRPIVVVGSFGLPYEDYYKKTKAIKRSRAVPRPESFRLDHESDITARCFGLWACAAITLIVMGILVALIMIMGK